LSRHAGLDAAIGARVWVKDETGNVSGSHKGRHLFGLMILLRVVERVGLLSPEQTTAPLAIASCGNAALAAAVVAAAAGRRLEVFVPVDADPAVIERLRALGAGLVVCRRDGSSGGDPCYRRFVVAVEAGAIPFGCQGTDNGLAVEGGATLAWETAEALAQAGVAPDRLVVQVGGGALASACVQGFREATALAVLPRMPTCDTVQTSGAYPLLRAYSAVADHVRRGASPDEAVVEAAHHRSDYMWPWEVTPASVAHGILDDETYDWLAVVRGMLETGGSVIVADERALIEANRLARGTTGLDVDHTGSAGVAGLLSGPVAPDTDVVVIFSGRRR
jgi:threonine synthase